jgi:outer membrane protein OmpA-like peptidoglycan-associated protein
MLQVVKIAYRCSAESTLASRLERALAESGRPVDVYEIYFTFNSDELRDESEPTLTELGDILRRHPDWKLSIAGHTDGIASDAFNLDLSKRRAAAVRNALVTRFGVGQRRLTTTGYGKSRPRDTNDTPEGRARNRRVELVRTS